MNKETILCACTKVCTRRSETKTKIQKQSKFLDIRYKNDIFSSRHDVLNMQSVGKDKRKRDTFLFDVVTAHEVKARIVYDTRQGKRRDNEFKKKDYVRAH